MIPIWATRMVKNSWWDLLPIVLGSVVGCSSLTGEVSGQPSTASQELVDCLLPGQIRQLEDQVTYVTERPRIQTNSEDCILRGGQVIK
jgi:hypothetical protein